jgi:predicted negative regulator of RcsB-dependent stress response
MNYDQETQQEIDALKHWWQENWLYLLGGIGLALVLIWGYRYWQASQLNHRTQASVIYEQLVSQATVVGLQPLDEGAYTDIAASAESLRQNFADTAYASLGSLAQANAAYQLEKVEVAEQVLRWVVEHGARPEQQEVARIRLASLLSEDGNRLEDALVLVDVEPGLYASQLYEVRGDLLLKMGKDRDAKSAYQSARQAAAELNVERPVLDMKIQSLGDEGERL